ncbi:hypothetical protein HDU77_005967 [Chytriomyces hyalinus]|nr:hypothetical protein HDU77_005967 [Chytriomyces hyalinus]
MRIESLPGARDADHTRGWMRIAKSLASLRGTALTAAAPSQPAQPAEFCPSPRLCISVSDGTVAVASSARGWISIAFAQSLKMHPNQAADVFVAWPVNGGYLLTRRFSQTLDSMPVFVENRPYQSINIAANIALSFNLSAVPQIKNTRCFFAYSDNPPTNASDPSSSFPIHDAWGSFSFADTSSTVALSTLATSSNHYAHVASHGIAMFFAWAVFPVIAIFTARYLKRKFSKTWVWIHAGISIVGTLSCVIGGIFAIERALAIEAPLKPTLRPRTFHGGLGVLCALVMLPLQMLLGVWVAVHWDNSLTKTPIHVKIHRWNGRILFLLAVIQIQLGLSLASAPAGIMVLYWLWVGGVAALFLVMGRKPSHYKSMPKVPHWSSRKTIMRHLDGVSNSLATATLWRGKRDRTNGRSDGGSPSNRITPTFSAQENSADDADSWASQGKLINNNNGQHDSSFGYGTRQDGIPLVNMKDFRTPINVAAVPPPPRRNSRLSSVHSLSSPTYQHENSGASIFFSDPVGIKGFSQTPQRVLFAEPDSSETISRKQLPQPPAQRILFEEPDEVDTLDRQQTRAQQASSARIYFEEPDEVESLSRGQTVPQPPLAQRVFFEEPDEVDTFSRNQTQRKEQPIQRMYFEEPDEMDSLARNPTGHAHQAPQRIFFEEPDEVGTLSRQQTQNVAPRERIFFAEPDDVDTLSRPQTYQQRPPMQRVFFEEPDEVDTISRDPMQQRQPLQRVFFEEPEEEDSLSRNQTREREPIQRVFFEEPDEEEEDTLPSIPSTQQQPMQRVFFDEPDEFETLSRSQTRQEHQLAQPQRIFFEEPDEFDSLSRHQTRETQQPNNISRVFYDEPDDLDDDEDYFMNHSRQQQQNQQQPPLQRIFFEEPEESEPFSHHQTPPEVQRIFFQEPGEINQPRPTRGRTRTPSRTASIHQVFFSEPEQPASPMQRILHYEPTRPTSPYSAYTGPSSSSPTPLSAMHSPPRTHVIQKEPEEDEMYSFTHEPRHRFFQTEFSPSRDANPEDGVGNAAASVSAAAGVTSPLFHGRTLQVVDGDEMSLSSSNTSNTLRSSLKRAAGGTTISTTFSTSTIVEPGDAFAGPLSPGKSVARRVTFSNGPHQVHHVSAAVSIPSEVEEEDGMDFVEWEDRAPRMMQESPVEVDETPENGRVRIMVEEPDDML